MLRQVIVLALVASALAVPTGRPSSCSLECHERTTFSYQEGKRYVYQYETRISTTILGSLDDQADVHIAATANIDVTSPCDYTLTLTDVILEGSSHAQEFAAAITKSPLRFSFQDGQVESVCGDVSEPAWVTNFKRGVLSTFQNSMTRTGHEDIKETDISGTCMTHYKSRVEGDVVIVDKVKDIRSCSHHGDLASYLGASAYVSDSPIQNLPIFNSDNQCHQTIEAGIIKTVECHEAHKFRPFSSMEGGAQTTVKTTLVLVSHDQPAVAPPSYEFIRKSPVFEKTTSTSVQAEVDMISQILADLDEASHGEVRPEVPRLFSKLVTSLKSLDFPTLTSIYTNTKEPHSHKFLVDAMPLVGTAAAVGVVKDMIINGDITGIEAEAWYTSLAFIKNPTPAVFIAIAPLLETGNKQAILGTSALINTYCKLHHNCEAVAGVQQALRAIETQLGSSCVTINEKEKNKVLVALKGLGNAGRFIGATEILQRCYTEDNDMEVRVAAIEAWRHTPCDYDRSNLLAVFQDDTKDSEIRIAAYLAVMTCPTDTVIATVKDRLTSEAVNQVGSFVWTHLTNLQESAAPGKQWVRELIGEELLQNKFNTQALKFSRNYESSFFTEELNMGAAVESNVIFSSKSFLPRSAMFNLTIDLFGESINFFEVGGRIQGFESYVERFFGPSGYFPQETVESIVRGMRQNKPDGKTSSLEQFLDRVTDDPEGSYYLRMFGNELHYNNFHGIENFFDTSNPVDMIMELLRGGDIDYTKSLQLIDSDYSIPTMSGLPVTLSAKGTATIALRINGNINANSLTNFNIEGHFHPSAAVQMDGVMMVDAHVTRKGLKVSSTLHTSTFVDGKVHINGGKLVDVIINTPKEKVEVIDVNTKFFIVEDDNLIEKDVEDKYHKEGCTPNVLGGHLCGELTFKSSSISGPIFPLSGPMSAKIYLQKTDTHTGYIFHYTYNPQEFLVKFDTPGSQVDRSLLISLAKADQTITLDLKTPLKSIHGSAQVTQEDNNKQLRLDLTLDNQATYSLDATIQITRDNSIVRYKPSLVITSPSGPILTVQSTFGLGGMQIPYFSSELSAEYVLPSGNKHQLHHTALARKQVSQDSTTYSFTFDFNPTQYPTMAIDFLYNTKLSTGRIETQGRLQRADVVWELEHSLAYVNENDRKHLDVRGSIKCPQRNVDLASTFTTNIDRNALMTVGELHLSPSLNYSINLSLNKMEDRHYKAQVAGKIGAQSWEFSGEIKDTTIRGQRRSGNVVCSLTSPTQNIVFESSLHSDANRLNVDAALSNDGQHYTFKTEVTRSSILVDINILKHLLLNSYVTESGETKKLHISAEWDKDVDPTKALVMDGILSPEELRATLRVLEREFSAHGRKVAEGFELVGQWAPDQTIVAKIHYSLSDDKSVTLSVETPFDGWQKQDVTVSVAVNQNQLNAQAMANWKNSQQVTFTIDANLQPGLTNNAFYTNILFSSPFSNFERLTFVLDHKMAAMNINTNMEATWNDKNINGVILLTPTDNGIDGSATFTSPFTQEAAIILHHQLAQTQLSSSLEAKYGSHVSTATLNGHIITESRKDIVLNLKLLTPVESLSETEVNVKYTFDGSVLAFITEGKVGDKRIMLSVNGDKTVTEASTSFSGDSRIITPYTSPLTATLSHSHDRQSFSTKFEMSNSFKFHADGHYISERDIAFNSFFTGPFVKSSVSLSHKIEESNIESNVEVSVNEGHIGASINGILDTVNSIANLKVDTFSTIQGLDDIKVTVDTTKNGNTWTSAFHVIKGDFDATLDHTLTFTDYFNWDNTFIINEAYVMKNTMTHSGTLYTFDLDSRFGEFFFHLATTADPKISAEARQFDGQVVLSSSWADDPFKVHLNYQDDGTEFKPTLNIGYKPGQVIQITSLFRIESSSYVHIESTLTTPFWATLGVKLGITWETRKVVSLELTRGPHKTTIIANGRWEDSSKATGRVDVTSTRINPITVEVSYDIASPEKTVSLAVTRDNTYSITAVVSGHRKAAQWHIRTELPIPSAQQIFIQGNYNIVSQPLTVKSEMTINTRKFEIDAALNSNDIQLNMDIDGRRGLLTSHWNFQETNGNLDFTFQLPVNNIRDFTFQGMYDFADEKKVNIKVNEGTAEVNFVGQITDSVASGFTLDVITPVPQIRSIRTNAVWNFRNPMKTFDISANFNNNPYTLHLEASPDSHLKGHMAIKFTSPISGWTNFGLQTDLDLTSTPLKAVFLYEKEQVAHKIEGHLTITSTSFNGDVITNIPGWESNVLLGDYNFQNEHFTTNLSVLHGTGAYHLESDVLFGEQPKIKVNVQTPFEITKNIDFNFEVTKTETNIITNVSLQRVDDIYSVVLTLQDSHKIGLAKLEIQSPIPDYTTIDLLAKYDFTGEVKMADMDLKIEGNAHHFSAAAEVNDNNVDLDIITPFEGFQTIKMTGDYIVTEGHHNIKATFNKNDQTFDFSCDLTTDTNELSVTLMTPIAAIRKVKVYCKFDILDHGVGTALKIQRNQEKLSLILKGDFTPSRSEFHASLKTPVAGWNVLLLDSQYNFISERKTAGISIKKNNVLKEITMEAHYSPEHGYFKLQTPFVGFEVLGTEYTLRLDTNNNNMEGTLKFNRNNQEWILTTQGLYTSNRIHFELNTPFQFFKNVSFILNKVWDANRKEATLQTNYNQYSLVVTTALGTSPSGFEFSFTSTTPFPNYEHMSIVAKYDINNRDALVSVYFKFGQRVYNFLVAGYVEEMLAYVKMDLTSPFTGWNDIKLEAKIDLTGDDRIFFVTLLRDTNIKVIDVHGKLIGSTVNINLKTPFDFIPDISFFGGLNRSKRSLDLRLVNDFGTTSFSANFNSVKIHIKTPFESAKDILWELSKTDEGKYKAEWRRNENYAVMTFERQGSSNALNVEVQSEFHGWELLALVGRLNEETLEGYLSGAINEEAIIITSSANLDTAGNMHMHIETPYERFRTIEFDLNYDVKQMMARVEGSSSPSPFHFLLEVNPSQGFKSHLLVPNPEKDTEVAINLGLRSGKIEVTSRFDFVESFLFQYNIRIASISRILSTVLLNDNELFKLESTVNTNERKAHVEIKLPNTAVLYHRQGFSSINFSFTHRGETEKQFSIDATTTGIDETTTENLPEQGALDIAITNSFVQPTITFSGHIQFDLTQDKKQVSLELTPRPSRLYKFDVLYDISYDTGDFDLRITTPDRRMARWKHISAKYNIANYDNINVEVNYGDKTYMIVGKLGLSESDLVVTTDPQRENIIFQWRFLPRDFFLKFGRLSKYAMLKMKVNFQDIRHVEIEGGFKAGPLMPVDFLYTFGWKTEPNGIFTSQGTVEYGPYHAENHLEVNHNINTHSATFTWTAESNVPGLTSFSLTGNYNFNRKAVFHGVAKLENMEAKLDIDFDDIHPDHSHNTVQLVLPFLPPQFQNVQLNIIHDFRDTSAKIISITGNISGEERYFKTQWTHSESYNTYSQETDIKSVFIGEVHATAKYDFSNFNDALAEVHYTRLTPNQETRSVNLKLVRKMTQNHYESELTFDSTHEVLSHGRFYATADFDDDFHLTSGLEWSNKRIAFIFDMNQDSISAQITTPFQNFESIETKSTYSLTGKTKKITFLYERGTRKIEMDFSLNLNSKKRGNTTFTLTTPLEAVKTLQIVASWNNNKADISIKRNNYEYKMTGTIDLEIENSSFNLSINIPGWQVIRIAASYNVHEFLAGSQDEIQNLAGLELEFEGNTIIFNMKGFRNEHELQIDVEGRTSFAIFNSYQFHLKREIHDQTYKGSLDLRVNDFDFKITNEYEKRGENGFYIKSMIETTLTPLPALIVGIGRNADETTLTVGYGEDRQITFSIKAKDNFASGFSGFVDIPNFGYDGVTYDVSYGFEGDDHLLFTITVDLGNDDDKIEVEFLYDSEGVRARLRSPFTGVRNLRFRRSISTDEFSAEAALDHYSIHLRGGFQDTDFKRGALLQVDVMGHKFLFDLLLQSQDLEYSEGKLIIMTPFTGFRNMGGLFTLSIQDQVIAGQAELLLPPFITPQIKMDLNLDLNQKMQGQFTLNIAGQKFIVKSNLVGNSPAEGYGGTLEIYTPFDFIPEVNVNACVKFVKWSSIEVSFGVNHKIITISYTLDETTFKTAIDVKIADTHKQLSIEAKYPSLNNIEGSVTMNLDGEIHSVSGVFNVEDKRIQGSMTLRSSMIEGHRIVNFDVSIPTANNDHIIFDVTFSAAETHSLFLDLSMASGITAIVRVDTPLMPKISATLILTPAQAELSLQTPSGMHKLSVGWRMTARLPADCIVTVEVMSPLLPHTYKFNVLLNGDAANMMLKSELHIDDVKHTMEGKAVIGDHSAEVSLTVNTPFRNINELALTASLTLGEHSELLISATNKDKVSNIHLTFDKADRKLQVLISSPFIPKGEVSMEAVLIGSMEPNLKLKLSTKYGNKILGAILNIKVISINNMMANLRLNTPFRGYKKINFQARYQKDDVTIITFTIDKPISLNFKLHLNHTDEKIMADLKLETSIENFKLLETKLEMPVSVFAPSVSLMVDLSGVSYGGQLKARIKAPYELGWRIFKDHRRTGGFHLKTDSSFFSVLA